MLRLLRSVCSLITLSLFIACVSHAEPSSGVSPVEKRPRSFVIGDNDFLLDGQRLVIRCGELHFARIPPEYWRHRLQMAKAMGLNTVCAYLFWNFHEWEEGRFDWSGWRDVAEFCRIAQEEGLWVLVRPGPYSCAEWEMGGLPWWLLKHDGIRLRTTDPVFLEPAVRYMKEVARVLAPLQVSRGGPILMVQVENEYGSFGKDADYMGALRQALIDGGIEVPLFACNPPGAIADGFREDLFQVVNFSPGGAERAFATLRKFQKTGPLMNGEYYPAWFDMWGVAHRTTNVRNFIGDLDYMLQRGQSFSIYMAHGGTSFGPWAGADRPFRPDTSSYDYDAPISEAGWPASSFEPLRELFGKHLLPGESLPPVPEPPPIVAVPTFRLDEVAPVFANLPPAIDEPGAPRPMELYGQSRGHVVYRTTLPAGPAGQLSAAAVHDFAWVFIDGKPAGVLDRRSKRYQLAIPARTRAARLDIYLATMGRVNFGQEIFDRKGLHAPITFTPAKGKATELKKWKVHPLPLDSAQLDALTFTKVDPAERPTGPAFWRGSFELTEVGDTFLDLRNWGKGYVWVNGHNLGRFWNIGPTQSMYLPAPWLKKGRNEVIVLDLLGPQWPEITGRLKPILDQLRPELDFARRVRASGRFSTDLLKPAVETKFRADIEWQTARFPKAARGRYLAIEALDSIDGKPHAAIAELDALDRKGEPISKTLWKVLWVSSEEVAAESGEAENALDGQPATYWHNQYQGASPEYPHRLVIDLGETVEIGGIRYLPRGGRADAPGRIGTARVYVSDQPFGLSTKTLDPADAPKPILDGLTADPSIRVFGDTYYVYPTSDKDQWLTTDFSVWSSKNLVDWKKERMILDVTRELAWADIRAWAPDCIERNGTYYFYFCADGKIGVATSKSPTGPFVDALGKPLLDRKADPRITSNTIDPYPFIDDDGQAYLYWGNSGGEVNVVKLKPDMITIDGPPIEFVIKGRSSGRVVDFREGIVVFKRNGRYYFMWSVDDARSDDYRVAYGTADGPFGPVHIPENATVLSKNGPAKGTGHHSIVRVPGTDRWYMAYHRHAIPYGNGYTRETCLARMEFAPDGAILPVDPMVSPFKPGDRGEPIALK